MEKKKLTKAWPALKSSALKIWQTENLGYIVKTYIAFAVVISLLIGLAGIVFAIFGLATGKSKDFDRTAQAQTIDPTMEAMMEITEDSTTMGDSMTGDDSMTNSTAPTTGVMMMEGTAPDEDMVEEELPDFDSMTDEELEAYIEEMMKQYDSSVPAGNLDMGSGVDSTFDPRGLVAAMVIFGVIFVFLGTLVMSFSKSLFIEAVINIEENTIPLIRDALKKASKKMWPMLGLVIITGLIVSTGFVLFIIPGVILSLVFVFAPFVLLKEEVGVFEALGRSAKLTKGYRWQLFVRLVVLMVITLLLALTSAVFGKMVMPYLSPLISGVFHLIVYRYYKEASEGAGVMNTETDNDNGNGTGNETEK